MSGTRDRMLNIVGNGNIIGDGNVVDGRTAANSTARVPVPGPDVTEARAVPRFTSVSIEAPVEFSYGVRGEHVPLNVIAPPEVSMHLRTEVAGQHLRVWFDAPISVLQRPRIQACGPSLSAVALHGSGRLEVSGIDDGAAHAEVNGSGHVVIAGRAKFARLVVTGSGHMDASALVAMSVEAVLTGSGSIRGHAFQRATTRLIGSGSIEIAGEPAERHVEQRGSGAVGIT